MSHENPVRITNVFICKHIFHYLCKVRLTLFQNDRKQILYDIDTIRQCCGLILLMLHLIAIRNTPPSIKKCGIAKVSLAPSLGSQSYKYPPWIYIRQELAQEWKTRSFLNLTDVYPGFCRIAEILHDDNWKLFNQEFTFCCMMAQF